MNGQQFAEALGMCAGKCGLPSLSLGGSMYDCHDFMAALAKADVPDVARRLVRWKYMDDTKEALPTYAALCERYDHDQVKTALLAAALKEWLGSPVCTTCNGGQSNSVAMGVCPACGGTGIRKMRTVVQSNDPIKAAIHQQTYDRIIGDIRDLAHECLVKGAALMTESSEMGMEA